VKTHRLFLILSVAALGFCTPQTPGGTHEAPRAVRVATSARFTQPPTVTGSGKDVRIAFAVSAQTDVEVAILGADGRVVRHLAAGLLGKHAPAPLQKNTLAQKLTWDGRDDLGRPFAGKHRVRVRIGSAAKIDRYVGWNGNTTESGITALACGPTGEVYVLYASGHGRTSLRVYDADGRYARTIIPYPAGTPAERTRSIGTLNVDGRRIPIVFNSHGGNALPLITGMKPQTMAFSPKGHLLLASAVGTIANHRPPRYILAVHPEGGAPTETGFVGPQIRGLADRGIGFMGGAGEGPSRWFSHLATSPEGDFIYLTDGGASYARKPDHCVYRLRWSDRKGGPPPRGKAYRDHGPDDLPPPVAGVKNESGTDDKHLSSPQGLATDAEARLYVCDNGNNRVMIYAPDGKLLGKFDVAKPLQIAVHPNSGIIYVLSGQPFARRRTSGTIHKFAAFRGEAPKKLASLTGRIFLLALDTSADPPKLWASTGSGLQPVFDKGRALEFGDAVLNHDGIKYPGFLAGDPKRNRVIYREMVTGRTRRPIRTLDLATGAKTPFLAGTDAQLDCDGNLYVMGSYGQNALFRYDPDGKPLPFPGLGTHKMPTGTFSSYGPDIGLRGHCVSLGGDIYVIRSNKWAGGVVNRVDVFSPQGKPKQTDFINGLQPGDCGIGVDAAGNVYVGVNVKPKTAPLPRWFAGQVPAKPWDWWRFDRQGPRDVPWAYPYQNTYLNHMGAVLKFGPEGGKIYGLAWATKPKDAPPPPLADVKNAPAAAAGHMSGNLKKEVRVVGAAWRYGGVGPIPSGDFGWGDPGCICWNSRLAVDPFGRVFAPNVFCFAVEMLDAAGNRIARLGTYGNSDDGTGGDPAIAFAWPAHVSVAEGKVFVCDPTNRRIAVIGFAWAAEVTLSP
jgi:hypothetical protein